MWNNTNVLQNLAKVHQNLLLYQLLCRDHLGGILGTSILETIVFPRLQGLNPAMKVVGNDTKPGQDLLLQDLDSVEERLDLLELLGHQWHLLP
jgi:hypothetical protein